MLTWSEIEARAVAFQKRWKNTPGDERQDGQTFEKDFMEVFGVDWREGLHEHLIYLKDGSPRYIDYLLPGKILIEMKSKGQSLAKAYTQAMEYVHALKPEDVPELIMCCDFNRIEVWNLKKDHRYKPFRVTQLKQNIRIFGLIAGYGTTDEEKTEIEVNTDASYKMAKLHDALKEKGYSGHSLELYLVRLLFCLFAEDTGVFEKEAFEKYIEASTPDGSDLSMRLMTLFSILDTPVEKRPKGLPDGLMRFRYINGSIFKDSLPLASFDSKMRGLLLECSKEFNWSKISPAIFGAMFQGVMDQDARRSLGAHYTSRENIMKVIQPLFLDELYDEFERNKATKKELLAFQDRLASLNYLDPACGSGNFLIVAYEELRKLEFEVLKLLYDYQENVFLDTMILVKPEQFNGIEIEDFPVQIANLSMILMKHQMDQEISNYFGVNAVDFPIRDTAHIVQANALRIDWNDVIPTSKLDYIMGNPPFHGTREMDADQTKEIKDIYLDEKGIRTKTAGLNDYVAGWFYKAAEIINETNIVAAFVSTNSITQGQQVESVWKILYDKFHIHINFAYRTFKWSNEAKGKAAVHVVIIGFSTSLKPPQCIWEEDGSQKNVSRINPYLVDAPTIFVKSRSTPFQNVSRMIKGNHSTDGGHLILSLDERDRLLNKYPDIDELIRPYITSKDFIRGESRYCLWLYNVAPSKYSKIPEIMLRIEQVKNFRLTSDKAKTRQDSEKPALFQEIRQPDNDYLFIPAVSSERRKYVPMGYISSEVIAGGGTLIVPNATSYEFGIIISNVHMAWMRAVAGRLEMRYRYSAALVYNTFIWPESNTTAIEKIKSTGMNILSIREKYNDSSLEELYNPLTMPHELLKAHQANDKAVWEAYGKAWDITSEEECVAHLMKLYAEMTGKK